MAVIYAYPTNAVIVGTEDDDTIYGSYDWDTIDGGGGNDWINDGPGHDRLRGGIGDDTLYASTEGSYLEGGAGNDWLEAAGEEALLFGGAGDDVLIGKASWDTLDGGTGADTLWGGAGHNVYYVGAGDVLVESGGRDEVVSTVSWKLAPGFEFLYLTGTAPTDGAGNGLDNHIAGNDAANWIATGAGDDDVLGGGGNDTIKLSPGDTQWGDEIDGGAGIDTLALSRLASAVTLDLQAGDDAWDLYIEGAWRGGNADGSGRGVVANVERVVGTHFGDRLAGSEAANVLLGAAGDDTLNGGGGRDVLTGGSGADVFRFVYPASEANAVRITDFVSGTDGLRLALPSSALGAAGHFSRGDPRFYAASGATSGHDASDRIVYDTSTGRLYLDADGSGGAAARLLATLVGAPALAARDISVSSGVFSGTAGGDSHAGNDDPDLMSGAGGNDTLDGGFANDTLYGGSGADSLVGREGADALAGGEGNDTLDGLSSSSRGHSEPWWDWDYDQRLPGDTLDGGAGDDTYYAQPNDLILDSGGIDTWVVFDTGGALPAGIENLTEIDGYDSEGGGVGHLDGNELDNVIQGGWTISIIDGGDGDDTLYGGDSYHGYDWFRFSLGSGDYGSDYVDGQLGWDVVDFADARSALVADLAAGTLVGGGTGGRGTATLVAIEEVIGGGFADRIVAGDVMPPYGDSWGPDADYRLSGGGGDDTLRGGPGSDILLGGTRNDRLVAHGGVDTLTGGAGADELVIARPPGAAVTLTGFVSGTDKLMLDAAHFSQLGPAGGFSSHDGRFYAAPGATSGHDAGDRVIYDTSTGTLYYDADGSGGASSQAIATLNHAPTLTASDVFVG